MALYKVRPGRRHGKDNEYGPGDVVEMTEQEAAGFLDKLDKLEPAGEGLRSTGGESDLAGPAVAASVVEVAATEEKKPRRKKVEGEQ